MMDGLKLQLRNIADRVDEMTLRERAIIFIALLVAMYLAADRFVIKPLTDQRTRMATELKSKRDQIQSAERQIQAIVSGDVLDGDPLKRTRLDALRAQLKAIETELNHTTSGLVTPKEMARLAERYFSGHRGVQVLKVESLPPEPVLKDAGANTAGKQEGSGALIYKHGMRIELRGSYLDLASYLQNLEAQSWKVFWGQASFEVDKGPKLTLVIYTLSTKEGWIGT